VSPDSTVFRIGSITKVFTAADSTGRVTHLTGGSWMVMERVR
jgi:hypothetical protein